MNGKLLRLLGVSFGAAVVVGTSLGIGILRTPNEVAARLPDPWLIVGAWLAGGLFSFLGVVSVAELGVALPYAGGFYVYVRRAFGDSAAFAMGCCDWLGQAAAAALGILTITEYAPQLWHGAGAAPRALGLAVVLVYTALLTGGTRLSARAQELTSFAKALAFGVLIAACLLTSQERPQTPPLTSLPGLPALVLVAQAVIYTYDGWYSAIYFTEEDVAPERNLLRSMLWGVALVTLIYVLMNVALLAILPVGEIAASTLPAADAARRVFGAPAGGVIATLAILSALGLYSGALLLCCRILFALSRDGALFPILAEVAANGQPVPALWMSAAAVAAMVATGTTPQLLALAGFYYVLNYASAYICLFRLRWTEPGLARPYRAWGYPYTTGLTLLVSIAFLGGAIWTDTANSAAAITLLVLAMALRSGARRMGWTR
ncbi:MAG: amino acid permease [Bryobacterales bacterium]|nr:amino acid permease [Bryobacterales bacterium]